MIYDYILVGGGLHNTLLALALAERQPAATLLLIEREGALGGNHTWSFHSADLSADERLLVDPLVSYCWAGYDVVFPPGWTRRIDGEYCAVLSPTLDAYARERLARAGREVLANAAVVAASENSVTTSDGERFSGRVVLDARGPNINRPANGCGYQKFVGLEVAFKEPVFLQRPILIDAAAPQHDGFRFFYTLPFSPRRALIEETYYSDGPILRKEALRESLLAYAAAKKWQVAEVLREESGVLPIPWKEDPRPRRPGRLDGGYAGGWFHPTTGYSLPIAARFAIQLASVPPARAPAAYRALARAHRRQAGFCRVLNRLLFRGYAPGRRWNVLARFYREFPTSLIRRFYALRMTRRDRLRILCGRPPNGFSLRRLLTGREV